MKKALLARMALLFLAMTLAAANAYAADKTIPPGTVITMQNWQQYKGFMNEGLIALFSGKYKWKFPADFRMAVTATTDYHLPPLYLKDTEKYSSQVKIVNLPDGGHNIEGYVAGLPFPNPQEPLRGWKLLVDNWYSYQPEVLCGPDGWAWSKDRFLNTSSVQQVWVNHLFSYLSDPGQPHFDPRGKGEYLVEFTRLMAPEQIKYLTVLTVYYADLSKAEDLYVFIPALRRSLRLATNARCAPFNGTDFTYDDTRRGAFNGNATRFDADYLGERQILESIDVTNDLKKLLNLDNYYQPVLWGKPALESFEVRKTWAINAHPIPAFAKGYCYGKRILYVDQQSYLSEWADLYDANGKFWKAQYDPQGMVAVPGVGQAWENTGWGSIYDMQNSHMSMVVLNFHANQNCKDRGGVDYTDVGHFASLSALSEILR